MNGILARGKKFENPMFNFKVSKWCFLTKLFEMNSFIWRNKITLSFEVSTFKTTYERACRKRLWIRLYQRTARTTRCQHLWTVILPIALMSVLFLRLWSIIKELENMKCLLKICKIIYWANNKLNHADNSYNNKNLILIDQFASSRGP